MRFFLFSLLAFAFFFGNFNTASARGLNTITTVMTFGNTSAVQIQTQSLLQTHTVSNELPTFVIHSVNISLEATSTTATIATTFVAAVNLPLQFSKDLHFGISDEEVKLLQKYLNAHGFFVSQSGNGSIGKETQYYGKATRAALTKFQKANGIVPASGYFGALTRSFVNSH